MRSLLSRKTKRQEMKGRAEGDGVWGGGRRAMTHLQHFPGRGEDQGQGGGLLQQHPVVGQLGAPEQLLETRQQAAGQACSTESESVPQL